MYEWCVCLCVEEGVSKGAWSICGCALRQRLISNCPVSRRKKHANRSREFRAQCVVVQTEATDEAPDLHPPTEQYLQLSHLLATYQTQAKTAKLSGDKSTQSMVGKKISEVRRSMVGLEKQHGKDMLVQFVADALQMESDMRHTIETQEALKTIDPRTLHDRSDDSLVDNPNVDQASAGSALERTSTQATAGCDQAESENDVASNDSEDGGFDGSSLFDMPIEDSEISATTASTEMPHDPHTTQYKISEWPTSYTVTGIGTQNPG